MTMKILSAATLSLLTSTSQAFLQQQHRCRISSSCSRRLLKRAASSDAGGGESRQQQDVAARQSLGKANQHMQKMVAREHRIVALEGLSTVLTSAQQGELNGLRQKSSSFDEQYDPSQFSAEHHAFKASHNQAFCDLFKYCCCNEVGESKESLFYLDGPDGQTTRLLLDDDMFQAHQLCVANRHEASCVKLRDLLPDANVVCQSATVALQEEVFGNMHNFAAYYFDGCGGHAPQVMDMVTAALQSSTTKRKRTAVGFSIVGGNRDVVNKEVQVAQHLVQLALSHGMQVHHVLDDPNKYGVASNLQKVEGATMTSWFVLEFTA